MATSTFERKIEFTRPEAVKRLAKFMSDEVPAKSITRDPSSREDQKRGEEILKRCPLRSPR